MFCAGVNLENSLTDPYKVCQSAEIAIVGGTAIACTALAISCFARQRTAGEDPIIQNVVTRPWITCCNSTAAIGGALAITGLAVHIFLYKA